MAHVGWRGGMCSIPQHHEAGISEICILGICKTTPRQALEEVLCWMSSFLLFSAGLTQNIA